MLFAGAAQAFWFGIPTGYYTPQAYYKYGAVYARTVVPGPNGKPVYVVYNDQGEEIAEIGETNTEPYASARVLAGNYYRALLTQLQQVREQYELTDQDLMRRDVFDNTTFKTVDDEETIEKPSLRDDTLWVAVRPADQRYTTDPAQLVLLELPIDPGQELAEDTQSLLLGKNGEILYQTPENIGFRVGFYGSETGQVNQGTRSYDDTLYGPLRGVYLSLGMAYTGAAITDEQGKYSMTYMLPPCPGFTFEFTTNVYLELYYKRFNPRGSPNFPYYLMRPGYDFCNGLGVYSLAAATIVATSATPVPRATDFPIDIIVLAGRARLANPDDGEIEIGAQTPTRYDASTSTLKRVQQDQYDLDGDGEADTTALGFIVTPPDGGAPYFQRQDQAPPELVQGVWLSSVHDVGAIEGELANGQTTTLPDLTRLPDWSADFDDRALLSSLSLEDLRDTDLYVFRESDGSLLIERRGLDERETSLIGADAERQRFFYTLRLLGGKGMNAMTMASGAAGFAQFQEAEGLLDPAQYQRAADHLRAGEYVRIIAINRPSGYMGSLSVPLQAAGSGADPTEISFPIDELVMRPPNLKIWAERQSQVEVGLTRGETREQAIGNEGAGLADDVLISLYTEWLDADGRPLPEALGEYGYTGRLAKVLEPNQLAPVEGSFSECDPACGEDGNQLSQFAIRPGRQLQVVRLPEAVQGKQHLYVHVSGTPASREPDFGSGGQAGSVLEFRPAKFVPVQVPVYDEATTHLALQVYNGLRADDPNRDLTRPAPVYRFVYRPEFQFSLYDLAVQEIRRTDVAGQTTDVLPLTQPVLASADQLVELYYDLLGPTLGDEPLPPLAPYSYAGERELVFALGEQELRATVGADGTLRFDNLDHLGLLNPEDYLTIRLYSNNDAGNVLWEWAFEYLALFTTQEIDTQYGGRVFVSADDPVLDLTAVLIGYDTRDESTRTLRRVNWSAEGNGIMNPRVVQNTEGTFESRLEMPPVAGAEAVVIAELEGAGPAQARYLPVEVIPGQPASIALTSTGQAYAQGVGELLVTATVYDAYGNRVIDGTSVTFSVESAVLAKFEGLTKNGRATATIKGGYASADGLRVKARVGDLVSTLTFNVHPLEVELVGVPETVGSQTLHTVTARVTGGGAPAANVFVDIGFDSGSVEQTIYKTDQNGELPFILRVGEADGEGRLTARADIRRQAEAIIGVVGGRTSSSHAFLVSDPNGLSTASYTGFTGQTKSIGFSRSMNIGITGPAQGTWQADFDDLHLPNHEPLLLFRFQQLGYDETGLHNGRAEFIRLSHDAPDGLGYSAFFPAATARLTVPHDSDLVPARPAFAARLKLDGPGPIINWGYGGIVLTGLPDRRLQLLVTTDAGTRRVESEPIPLGTWIKVAGGMNGSEIYLAVGDSRYSLATPGESIAYGADPDTGTQQGASSWLTLGKGFSGSLSLLRLYDLASPALIRLAGGATGQYDEQGRASIPVESTDALGISRPLSRLRSTSVGLRINGSSRPVTLTHSQEFVRYAGLLSDVFGEGDIDQEQFEQRIRLQGQFPRSDAVAEKVLELASDTTVGGPLNVVLASVGALAFRYDTASLAGHVKNIQRFYYEQGQDAMLMAVADLLGEAVKRALRGDEMMLRVMQTALVVLSETVDTSPTAAATLARAITSRDQLWIWMRFLSLPAKGWTGPIIPIPQPDRLCDGLAPTVNAGTVLEYNRIPCRVHGTVVATIIDEWAAEELELAANPVALTDDIRVLVNGLKGAPLEFNRMVFGVQDNTITASRWPSPIGTAHAAAPVLARPLIFALKSMLKIIKKHGVNHFVNFLQNRTNMRFKSIEVLAAMGYLGSRHPGCTGCKELDPAVFNAINTNLTRWLMGLTLAKNGDLDDPEFTANQKQRACMLSGMAHGSILEVIAAALYHGMYEFGNLDEYQIIAASNTPVPVPLYKRGLEEDEPVPYFAKKPAFDRKPDLILAGAGPQQRTWVELKSWKYSSDYYDATQGRLKGSRFPIWTPSQGKSKVNTADENGSTNRQFVLDRIASARTLDRVYWNDIASADALKLRPAKDGMQWWVHIWNKEDKARMYQPPYRKGQPRPDPIPVHVATPWSEVKDWPTLTNHFQAFRKYLTSLPKVNDDTVKESLGLGNGALSVAAENENYQRNVVEQRCGPVAPFSLRTFGLCTARDAIVQQVKDMLSAEVLRDSRYKEFLGAGELTEAQLQQLYQTLEEEVNAMLGPIQDIIEAVDAVTPQAVQDLEEWLQGHIEGVVGEEELAKIGQIEIPEMGQSFFDCDDE